MDPVIADSGIDAVICRVARKADISEQAATVAVDEVLTAVKQNLPPRMACRLVEVVAGESEFKGHRIPAIPELRRLAETRWRQLELNLTFDCVRNTVARLGAQFWKESKSLARRLRSVISRTGSAAGR